VPVHTVACVPAPAMFLQDVGEGRVAVDPFDCGCDGAEVVQVNWYRNGVLEVSAFISAGDLLADGANHVTDGIDQWTASLTLPDGCAYCAGETVQSNVVNFG
jgi:hypothetical protein